MTNRRNILLLLFLIISHQGEFTINTTGMGDTMETAWSKPTSGGYLKLADSRYNDNDTRKFTPPNPIGFSCSAKVASKKPYI